MSKKSKKQEFDIDSTKQKELLDMFDTALSAGEIPGNQGYYHDDEEDESEIDNIGNLIASRLSMNLNIGGCNDNDDDETSQSPVFAFEAIRTDTKSKEPEFDMKLYNEFTIKTGDTEFNTVEFSDGIRKLTIDLNTLSQDDYDIRDDCDDIDKIKEIAYMRLEELIQNFYPTAILPINKVTESFRHIDSVDDEKFKFFSHPKNSSIVYGYYISDATMEEFYNIIEKSVKSGSFFAFFETLATMCECIGFSFKYLPFNYADQMMLTKRYKMSTDHFIMDVLEDDETKTSEDTDNDTIYQAVTVFPYNYHNDLLKNLFDNDEDDEEDDDDYDEDDEDDEEDDEVVDTKCEDTKDVETAQTPVPPVQETHKVVYTEPKISEVDEKAPDVEIEESSPDDLFDDDPYVQEEIAFNAKSRNEPRTSMKRTNKYSDNDDDSFVVKRQK